MYTGFPINSQLFGPSLKNLFTEFMLLSTYLATVLSRLCTKMMHQQEQSYKASKIYYVFIDFTYWLIH